MLRSAGTGGRGGPAALFHDALVVGHEVSLLRAPSSGVGVVHLFRVPGRDFRAQDGAAVAHVDARGSWIASCSCGASTSWNVAATRHGGAVRASFLNGLRAWPGQADTGINSSPSA
jgi:hypothetical protein